MQYAIGGQGLLYFVIAHEPRKDGQPRRIGRCPAGGPQRAICVQIKQSAIRCLPASIALQIGQEHFVELTGPALENNYMTITGASGAAFDGRVCRNRIGPGVTLISVLSEYDGNRGLSGGNH